jgi:hypothetical protein
VKEYNSPSEFCNLKPYPGARPWIKNTNVRTQNALRRVRKRVGGKDKAWTRSTRNEYET